MSQTGFSHEHPQARIARLTDELVQRRIQQDNVALSEDETSTAHEYVKHLAGKFESSDSYLEKPSIEQARFGLTPELHTLINFCFREAIFDEPWLGDIAA